MTVLGALAMATIARPDGAVPPTLEATLRTACSNAWRAVEVVLAGPSLRDRLGRATDKRVRDGVEAVLGLFAKDIAIRGEALTELRAARRAGVLDGALDMTALVASCARVGETPAVVAGRRRVRGQAIDKLKAALAAHRALAAAVNDTAIAALLVDASRAAFRYAVRNDKDLARWTMTIGPDTRDRALATFAELVASTEATAELDRLITAPVQLDENVQFTIYRPRSIEPRTWHPLLAFAHLAERRPDEVDAPDPVDEVRKQAEAVLGERAKAYQAIVQDSRSAIPVDGELTFVPEIAGVEFNPPRRSFLWLEPVHREDFRMRAAAELDGTTARGRITVFLGHIAIAEIALSVRVDAAKPEAVQDTTSARTYRKIFASYSHRDVAIVNQFEQYARALGDEYIRDWVHLRTGEVWTDRLRQLIEQADAFQLFWSHNAMSSKFVQLEYEHALSLNRPRFVRPTYWEEPMPTAPGLPPEGLLRLHFQKIGGETAAIGAGSRVAAPATPVIPAPVAAAAAAPTAAAARAPSSDAARRRSEPLEAKRAAAPARSPHPEPEKSRAAAARSEHAVEEPRPVVVEERVADAESTRPSPSKEEAKSGIATELPREEPDLARREDKEPIVDEREPAQLPSPAPSGAPPTPLVVPGDAPPSLASVDASAVVGRKPPPVDPPSTGRVWIVIAIVMLIVAAVVIYMAR